MSNLPIECFGRVFVYLSSSTASFNVVATAQEECAWWMWVGRGMQGLKRPGSEKGRSWRDGGVFGLVVRVSRGVMLKTGDML